MQNPGESADPLRVLQIITSLSTGGAEVMLRNLLMSADRRAFEFRVVSLTSRSPVGDEIAALGIPVIALEARGGILLPGHLGQVLKLVREWRPAVIHAWMYHSNILAHLIRALARESHPALITSIRGSLNAPDAQGLGLKVIRWLDARLSRRSDRVLFNSVASVGQHAATGHAIHRAMVIPNGFDTGHFCPDSQDRLRLRCELGLSQALAVGMIGRFHPVKGHRQFLEAAARVAVREPASRFVLAGRGCDASNPELDRLIRRLGLAGRTLLLGERRDVVSLLRALDILVSPSLSEGFPNVVGEAMSCAVPVVVTDVGDGARLVGEAGRLVSPRDPGALAAAVLELAHLTPLQRSLVGEQGRARITAEYSLPAIALRYEALYQAVGRSRDD